MSERSFDLVVIGGGVIGLSCAWRAAQRGARVAVVERSRPPAGATRVAAGMLAPVGELSFGEPELLKLTLAAAELYPDFVAELEAASGLPTGYRRDGALHVGLDRDEAAELRRVHELQRSLDLGAEWLPPRRCRELEPGLTPSLNGGVHAPRGGLDRPAGAGRRTACCAGEAEGVELLSGTEVGEALLDGGRLVGVRLPGGEELRAAAVVLAAGAWSGQAEWLPEPARPPVRPVKGQILELRSRDGAAPCSRIVASERDLPGAARRRPPDRRRDGRGAGLRHRRDRGRRARAAARGLPAAARDRRDGAGRGRGRRCAPALPTTCRWSARRRSTACSGRPATSATASCWRRWPPTPSSSDSKPRRVRLLSGTRPQTANALPRARYEDRAERRAARAARRGRRSPTRCARAAPTRAPAGVAVALDGEVVPRAEWDSTVLDEGAASRSSPRSRAAQRQLGAGRPAVELAADRRHRRLPLAGADGGGAGRLREPRSSPSPCAASTPPPRARSST